MVVAHNLIKVSYFIHVQSTYKIVRIVDIFMKEIFKLHGFPKVMISNKDVKFMSSFWKTIFTFLGTHIHFSIAYHRKHYS